MEKILKELTDFSEMDGEELSPSDNRSFGEETLTVVLFVVVIVMLIVIYWLYQWSSQV